MDLIDIDATLAQRIFPVMSTILTKIVDRNDKVAQCLKPPARLAGFYGYQAPRITIAEYTERIGMYGCCSPSCFVLGMIYIDRLMSKEPMLHLNSLNIHRILVTAVMLGAKFIEDLSLTNERWAKIAGVPCRDLNRLELDFLFIIDFNLTVNADTFREYYSNMVHSNVVAPRPVTAPVTPVIAAPPVPTRSDLFLDKALVQQKRRGVACC